LIEERTGTRPVLVVGGRGEFTVWVGETRVAQKTAGEFPDDAAALAAVQQALGR